MNLNKNLLTFVLMLFCGTWMHPQSADQVANQDQINLELHSIISKFEAQKYSQIYILNFLIEKRVLSDSREKLIWQLKNNTNYTTNKIMEKAMKNTINKMFI